MGSPKKFSIRDGWCAEGVHFEDFEKICRDMAYSTIYIESGFDNLDVLSFKEFGQDDTPVWFELTGETIERFEKTGAITGGAAVSYPGITNAALRQELEESGTRIMLNNLNDPTVGPYLVSSYAFATLPQTFKSTSEFAREPGLCRDVGIKRNLMRLGNTKKCTLVARKMSGMCKIFAVMAGGSPGIPMTVLSEAAKNILKEEQYGHPDLIGWHADHAVTEITFEFPDLAVSDGMPEKLIPGVVFRNSDIGRSSLTVLGTVRKDSADESVVITKKTKAHTKRFANGEDFLRRSFEEAISDTGRFFRKIRELGKETVCPEADLRTEAGRTGNRNALNALIRRYASGSSLNTYLGTDGAIAFVKTAVEERLDPAQRYTAADVVLTLFSVPDILIMDDRLRNMENIRTACGNIPFVNPVKAPKKEAIAS